MSKLTLDATLPEKLRQAQETVAICDEQGRELGRYHPTADAEKVVRWLDAHAGAAELDRREAEGPPVKLADIKRRLANA